jgi:hypothetical protein
MEKKNKKQVRKIDPEREMAFKALPLQVKALLTEEEKELFLYGEEWPETLFEKMKEFIV